MTTDFSNSIFQLLIVFISAFQKCLQLIGKVLSRTLRCRKVLVFNILFYSSIDQPQYNNAHNDEWKEKSEIQQYLNFSR